MSDVSSLLSKSLKDKHIALKEQGRVLPLFKSRWLMLGLLTLLTVNSITQWLFFSAITNTIKLYFNVPLYAVQFLSTSGMVIFVVFVVPCAWIVQKTSLRTGCLINGCLNTIAAVTKYFAFSVPSASAYSLTLTGQIISSMATCFILPMPAKLAAVWFGRNERSLATSMIASGHVIGISFSCLLSVIFVGSASSDISRGLKYSQLCQASLSLLLTLAVYILFKSKPPIHPSKSQAMVDIMFMNFKATFKEALSILVKNMDYSLFFIAYGVICGAMFAFWFIAQEAIPEQARIVGAIAGILAVPGMLISGSWLDRTKTYMSSMVLVSFLTVLTALAFTLQLALSTSILGIYIISGAYGFLISSFISMGLVFSSEITYPASETFSSGLLLISSQIFGIILTIIVSLIYSTTHHVAISSGILTGVTFLAALLISFVKFNFKRFAKDNLNNNVD